MSAGPGLGDPSVRRRLRTLGATDLVIFVAGISVVAWTGGIPWLVAWFVAFWIGHGVLNRVVLRISSPMPDEALESALARLDGMRFAAAELVALLAALVTFAIAAYLESLALEVPIIRASVDVLRREDVLQVAIAHLGAANLFRLALQCDADSMDPAKYPSVMASVIIEHSPALDPVERARRWRRRFARAAFFFLLGDAYAVVSIARIVGA